MSLLSYRVKKFTYTNSLKNGLVVKRKNNGVQA